MKIQVRKLRDAMDLLNPVVPKKSTIPVLTYVLLKDGQAIANDMETAVAVDLPEVEGQCLVPFRPVADLLKHVPGHEMLTIEQSDTVLSLDWAEGKASYETLLPEDYPPMPRVTARVEQTVDGDTLIPALLSVVDYCATGDGRPVLSGVFLLLGDAVEVAAADGFRLATRTLPVTIPAAGQLTSVIIPARTVRILGHLWAKAPRTARAADSLVALVSAKGLIDIALGELALSLGGEASGYRALRARFGPVSLISRLIEGTPPNWKQLIPQDPSITVRVLAPDIERAVRRVKEIAEDGSGIVRFTWADGAMTVSAKSEEKGEVEATIPVNIQGEPGKVALNVDYLLRYLKGKSGLVTMGVSNTTGPVTFRHSTSPLVLLMPMMVQW